MEIKRIKSIQNVGTFANFVSGGSLEFEKLTFIYGFNTFGKTTLTDIFQSIKDNNANIINARKTIPNQTTNQKIQMQIKESGSTSESSLKFENNFWSRSDIAKYIEIFSTEFIHKNLFTGSKPERGNKENFTQFILGEDGVQKANQIAEKKKELGEKKRDIKTQIPYFVKGKMEPEIQAFLDLSINGLNKEQLQEELTTKEQERKTEANRLKEPQHILGLPAIPAFFYSNLEIDLYFENINDVLKSSYSNIKEEVLKKIDEHIQNSFMDTKNAPNWIKQGREIIANRHNGNCSYCGQSLTNAKELMSAYDLYFDEEYNKYIANVEKICKENIELLDKFAFNHIIKLQDILSKVLKYQEFNKDQIFQEKILELETNIEMINEDELNISKDGLIQKLRIKIEEKIKKPYVPVNELEVVDMKAKVDIYKNLLDGIKIIIEDIKSMVVEFKKQYEDIQVIQDKINSFDEKIQALQMKIARMEQNQECLDYKTTKTQLENLETEIPELETELATTQNDYLTTYFTKIDELFRKFGSSNFTLEKSTSSKGHSPIYFLEVKFRGQKINDEDLKTVFSESDRRALALAVFWAKIELKPTDEKSKTVIVLDDPITSFDDNRIINSINLFKESLDFISQIIILTHYPSFLKVFCERTKESSNTTKFFKIEKDATTSKLAMEARETFTDSVYEIKFKKIIGFINREHNDCIKSDLRPFLESLYLPTVFAKSIKEAKARGESLSDLNDTINIIFSDNSIKNKFHSFRNNLNPEAHIFTSNNSEDVRNFAQEMMDYLYSFRF